MLSLVEKASVMIIMDDAQISYAYDGYAIGEYV